MLISEDTQFDIFVGSRIGSLKHIKYNTDPSKNNKKCIENLIDIKTLQKDDCITSMVWGNVEQTEILLGKKNQQIQVYNTELDSIVKSYTADFGTGPVVGLGRHKRKLLAAVQSGIVKIWSKKAEVTVNTGGKLDTMRVCEDEPEVFATGGEENDLKLWRIGEPEPTFTAKNLAHDWLQLRRPVWVSACCFMPGEAGRLVAVTSTHGYIRLYDARAQRRPVINVECEGKAAVCISPGFDSREVLVGFARGQLHAVDLRRGRLDRGFPGAAGAVRATACGPARTVVAVSLDRHIRVHGYEEKCVIYKQYLTSKLSCVLVQTVTSTPLRRSPREEAKDEGKEEAGEDDLDVLFDNMETVGIKSRKTKSEEEVPEDAKKMKPSVEGSTDEDAIKKLLKSTEKQKKRLEKKKREKKAKSLYHNA